MSRPLVKPAGVRDGVELVEHDFVRFGAVYICANSQVEPGATWLPLCGCFGPLASRPGECLDKPPGSSR